MTVQLKLAVPGYAVDHTKTYPTSIILAVDRQEEALREAVICLLNWAIVNENGAQDHARIVFNWFAHQASIPNNAKTAVSLINELAQQVSGLTIHHTDHPMTGPAHNPVCRYTLKLILRDGRYWVGEGTSNAKKRALEAAATSIAAQCNNSMLPITEPTSATPAAQRV